MSDAIKSWCRYGVGREQQALTDKRRRKKPNREFPPGVPIAFFRVNRLKPTATSHGSVSIPRDLETGRPTSSTTVTISTTQTTNSRNRTRTTRQRLFFSLNAGAEVYMGGAQAPPKGGPPARPRRISATSSEHSSGVGAQTPTPASHHVGVSGGGCGHHVTPSWCEAAREVVADV